MQQFSRFGAFKGLLHSEGKKDIFRQFCVFLRQKKNKYNNNNKNSTSVELIKLVYQY